MQHRGSADEAQGQFTIQPAPVGLLELLVDGSTAQDPALTRLGLRYVKWLDNNTVGMPIFLLPLNPNNQLV